MSMMTNYLRDVAMLEGQLYTQNGIITRLKKRINSLGISHAYNIPKRGSWKFNLFGVTSWLLYPASAIVLVYKIFFDTTVWKLLPMIKDIGMTLLWVVIIEIAVRNLCSFIVYSTSDYQSYKKELQKYNDAVAGDKRRVQNELVLKQELEHQVKQVEREKATTRKALDSLYAIGLIHKKYRYNIIAVASFFDYFDTGRCLSFTGPGGAYATYEEDLRFQRLETKLEVIISKLDEIIANQHMLASLMREANSTLYRIEQSNKRMMQSVSRIERNSELIEYNTRCAMQSSAVMEHIMLYNTLKNN